MNEVDDFTISYVKWNISSINILNERVIFILFVMYP